MTLFLFACTWIGGMCAGALVQMVLDDRDERRGEVRGGN